MFAVFFNVLLDSQPTRPEGNLVMSFINLYFFQQLNGSKKCDGSTTDAFIDTGMIAELMRAIERL